METSKVPAQTKASSHSLRQIMQQHPLFFFFLLAYVFSWIMLIPFILSEWGLLAGDWRIAFILNTFVGPTLAAFVMTKVTEGKAGVNALRQRIKQRRAGRAWYLFILLGIPALLILGIILQPGALASFKGLTPTVLISYPITYVIVFFGGGPLGEEIGWRGFALPRMQPRYGPLWGTLLLGVVWTFWHLPHFLTSAQGGGPGTGLNAFLTNFPVFLLLVIAIAILLTWIFNHTQGSIFIAILAHASINTPQVAIVPLFPGLTTTSLNLAALIAFGVPAVLIVILTRGKLGYKAEQEEPLPLDETQTQPVL